MLTLADIRRRARSRLDDLKAPYLWSDEELLDAINDTVRDAAVRANLTVQDEVLLPFTQKVDLTWNSKYALPSGYLKVKSVYLTSQPTYTLLQTSIRKQEQMYGGRLNQTGSPYAYALDKTQAGSGDDTGIQVRTITFIGTPKAADTAHLDVIRLPTLLESDGDVPEIDEIWHPDLVFGITGLAYLKRDADTYDPERSARDLQLFSDRFGDRLPAVVIRERQTDVPLEMTVE
jgi:hypothetical protein